MKKVVICCLFVFIALSGQAQRNEPVYSIAFYNVENLFDTVPDPGKNDSEYQPRGTKKWNTEKYKSKLKNIARVISELATPTAPQGPAVIGLAEVENRFVLQDLVKQPKIAARGYDFVHFEGPDARGIDCALLYDPKQFAPYSSKLIPFRYQNNDDTHKTRGFLMVKGKLAKEHVCIIVSHWPSRGAEAPVRIWAGKQLKTLTDSLMNDNPRLKIISMGDMNDDPMDESMAVALGAKKHIRDVEKNGFYNPWWETLQDKGVGTLLYRGKWNLFDQIVISHTLLGNKNKRLRYDSHEVFLRDYLLQREGRYKGSPFRTHSGNTWINGYSDHLPVILYLRK